MDKDQLRIEFYDAIANNEMDLRTTIKKMRKIVGMTQAEYAKFVGIAPRIVIDIERGVGNPTLSSLMKIAKPFGLSVIFGKLKE